MVNSQIKMENVNLAQASVKFVKMPKIVKNVKKVNVKLMENASKKRNTNVPMANINKIILMIIALNVLIVKNAPTKLGVMTKLIPVTKNVLHPILNFKKNVLKNVQSI